MTVEYVVLVDQLGQPIGTADKATVHTSDTPLHLAFSAWLVRDGKVLLSRRALSKKTWPGVWTNACCGHPGPGEATPAAVLRRAEFELGLSPQHLEVSEVVPDFSYRATDSSGIVENEICPVFYGEFAADAPLRPNPAEVDAVAWIAAADLVAAVAAAPFTFSPWLVAELADPRLRRALGLSAEG